jgi:hypothetical protein
MINENVAMVRGSLEGSSEPNETAPLTTTIEGADSNSA